MINRALINNLHRIVKEKELEDYRRSRRAKYFEDNDRSEKSMNIGNLDMQESTFAVVKSTRPTFVPVEDEDHMYYLPSEEIVSETLEGVKCTECGAIHIADYNSTKVDFITIIGNMSVNNGGGVIGNGDWKEYGVPVSHFCRSCLINKIRNIT